MTVLEVVRAGALTTVQDRGRPGHAHLGVPPSGALDPAAMQLANRLVGNDEGAAVLETTLDGVAFRLDGERAIAVTGAIAPVEVDGRPAAWGTAIAVRRGEVLAVGAALAGVRSYVAVGGGLLAQATLGSRSTDLLSGLGPPPLREAMRVAVGPVCAPAPILDFVPHSEPRHELDLPCWLGPRHAELTAAAIEVLATTSWTVSSASNRIGLRLEGALLERTSGRELATEGLVAGAIQVPPNGQPVLFLADHPTTGGYPVVAVVPKPELWLCAQAAPGDRLRLHPRRGRLARP